MTGAVLALGLALVYWTAPVSFIGDPRYQLLLSHHLWAEHTWDLGRYFPAPTVLPYQVRTVDGHVVYHYPPGPSLLALPVVAVADVLGQGPAPGGAYELEQETRLQRGLAAILTALWVWLVYVTARRWLTPVSAFLVGAAVGLGTPALSTLSRGLFFETWLLLGVQAALLLTLRGAAPILLGTWLAWLELLRPSAVRADRTTPPMVEAHGGHARPALP